MSRIPTLAALCLLLGAAAPASSRELIRLANNPSLSPDGQLLAFDWNGDLWTVPATGGTARQMTFHTGRDRQPKFSPDGKEIAFISDRDGNPQVYVMPASGGTPTQLTFHTAGFALLEWYPDGQGLLVESVRDHYWRHGERFFRIARQGRSAEQLLFDDYGRNGTVSPDGKRLLFTREGEQWWRKGYRGAQATQVWLHDLGDNGFTRTLAEDTSCSFPLWKPDGRGFYFVGNRNGSANLCEYNLDGGQQRLLTQMKDDSVVYPCIARDGSTIVFRQLFDLYRFRPISAEPPQKLEIWHDGDTVAQRTERRVLQTASQAAFSNDGLEIAFIAGGDLWVMDTELKEPRRVTNTPEEERGVVFSPDGDSLFFVSDGGGQADLWKATRADKNLYWWQSDRFVLERLSNDSEVESALKFSPDGKQLAFVRGRGDLWVADAKGTNARRLQEGWNAPDYDWSADGKWIVLARSDDDFNRDIWLLAVDGSRKPFNLSRHPYNDGNPVWSPDGKMIAFSGRRAHGEGAYISFVHLRAEDDEKGSRERTIEKALDKINRARRPLTGRGDEASAPRSSTEVVIDWDRLHERIHRVTVRDGSVTDMLWSPDSKRLAFIGSVEGRTGTYTLDLPESTTPTLLSTQTGSGARWLRQSNQIVWLASGVPSSLPVAGASAARTATPSLPAGGRFGRLGGGASPTAPTTEAPASTGVQGTAYRFQALQEVDLAKRNQAAYDLAWRAMRDGFYDGRLGNRDWDAVRRKYREVAGQLSDIESLETIVNLMLGELNGSHLGFSALRGGLGRGPVTPGAPPTSEEPASRSWSVVTAHLGVRFDDHHAGPGLKVRDVLPGGPAANKKSRIEAGEVILSIDGTAVDPTLDLTTVLNGPMPRDMRLKVRNPDGKERDVTLRPITYPNARSLLYDKWLADNRRAVEELSKGSLGYLHINAMSMPSFYRFEEELFSIGAGKEGLVIDVRENGGGSTTDHLLTTLTQPVHAITVPRGGHQGYPQDRKVYGSWSKPIVVLCNQNSFSNAEIFSHAIKTLKRGQLVGVPTSGSVISTGATSIMDVGTLRMPGRGWFLVNDGEDMELNGAVPHHVIWPKPGEMPRGKDVQLEKAVTVLLDDVKAWKDRPQVTLRKATERGSPAPMAAGR